jgi:hypothetical protein
MTDTNYNDGKWHGWNGGECPVHPESKVLIMVFSKNLNSGHSRECAANSVNWHSNNIIAFRVTKEHKEPREWWLIGPNWTDDEEMAKAMEKDGFEAIHVHEVIGDDT